MKCSLLRDLSIQWVNFVPIGPENGREVGKPDRPLDAIVLDKCHHAAQRT
jgi:hypothetical protein